MRPAVFKDRRRSCRSFSPHDAGTMVFVAGLAACGAYANLPERAGGGGVSDIAGAFEGHVTQVVDGDTFRIGSMDQRTRVWGLDAPEAGTSAGSWTTDALTKLIAGEQLTCRLRDIDRYGRIVGQCFLLDGRDVTAAMIATGTAVEFWRYSGNHFGTC